ncbi:MAG: hypothetical protein C0433_14740 [Cyclobacterium sp.]|jgi:hypothetical protein|nr:hypothetical protein [Cyclobacterium sp.]
MLVCKNLGSNNISITYDYQFDAVIVCKDCELWSRIKIDECCKNPYEIFVFQYVDGKPTFLREQCLNCDGCSNMNKLLNFKKYSEMVDERFSFSNIRPEEYKSELKPRFQSG